MITNDNISYCSDGSYDITDDDISTASASSYKEENFKELVLSNETNQGKLAFGNIAVVNSSNVHFGNKTVYDGPVTIKQFLYAKQQTISDLNSGNNKFPDDNNKSCVPDSVNSNNNINLGLHSSRTTISNKNSTNCNSNSSEGVIKKDLKWIRNILRQHLPLMISLSGLLLLSLIVLMTVLLTRHKTVVYSFDTNEQNQNSPTYFDSWSIKSFWKKHIKLLVMAAVILVLLIISIVCAVIFTHNEIVNKDFISREEWGAEPPKENLTEMHLPVPYVIVGHAASENCTTLKTCIELVRNIQFFHMESRNWSDIGYNFLVGGDGRAYEGRGWKPQGAHTYGYNYKSIGISFIGTFNDYLPPERQIVAAKTLIRIGAEKGYIDKNYKLFAARQLSTLLSPGIPLYENIQTWPHWTAEPDEKL